MKYTKPVAELQKFESADVVTTSVIETPEIGRASCRERV